MFLSAGESSGDLHGAHLARQLLDRDPSLRLVGLGGSRMRDAGVELLADLDTLAVMGLAEVIRSLPRLALLRWRVRRHLRREGVDLLVPIDYPGFNLSLACHAHGLGIPVLYYIAPQVWAWRASRAKKLAECADRVCVVLPFEEEFLADYGVDVRFVGHPLLDGDVPGGRPGHADVVRDGRTSGDGDAPSDADAAAREAGPAPGGDPDDRDGAPADGSGGGAPVLGLFPGSRAQEVEQMLPPFLEASRLLRREWPDLRVLVARAPDLPRSLFPVRGVEVDRPDAVLTAARAALTKSGTVTLQLALADVPMVVGHRMNPLTYLVARKLVRVEHVALANLVAGRGVVPELLQDDLTPEALARAAAPFLRRGDPERKRVREGLEEVRSRLGEPGCSARVAREAFRLLEAGA